MTDSPLYDLIVDHPMWQHDGEPLEYDPERESEIGKFLDTADEIIAAREKIAARRAWAEGVLHCEPDGLNTDPNPYD
jgi:hypothetical protein